MASVSFMLSAFQWEKKTEKPRLLETGGALGGDKCMLMYYLCFCCEFQLQWGHLRRNQKQEQIWIIDLIIDLFFLVLFQTTDKSNIDGFYSPPARRANVDQMAQKQENYLFVDPEGGSIVNRRWQVPCLCSVDGALYWLSRHYQCSSIQVEFPWALLITRPLCPPSAAENGSHPPRQHINICRNAKPEQRSREQRGESDPSPLTSSCIELMRCFWQAFYWL